MKRRGFTLWELVVAIGVVVVIAAILFPVFTRSRETDCRRTCSSGLKQIALGFKQYVQDYDEAFPMASNSASGLENPDNWIGQLEPFAKTQQVFQCPVDGHAIDNEKSSYGYNSALSRLSDKLINNSAVVILNFEVVADPNNFTQTGSGLKSVTADKRHLDGAYYSFADGHVIWLKPNYVGARKLSATA